jgi:hypothetical protein
MRMKELGQDWLALPVLTCPEVKPEYADLRFVSAVAGEPT